jgi:hypothetical protein
MCSAWPAPPTGARRNDPRPRIGSSVNG